MPRRIATMFLSMNSRSIIGEVCRDVSRGDACCIVVTAMSPRSLPPSRKRASGGGYTVSSFVFEAGEAVENASDLCSGPAGFFAHAGAYALVARRRFRRRRCGRLGGIRGCHSHARYSVRSGAYLALARVDSSVGGKTAVDLPEGKNLCGRVLPARYHVYRHVASATLPKHFFIDGCGEVLKYGVIFDKELFAQR